MMKRKKIIGFINLQSTHYQVSNMINYWLKCTALFTNTEQWNAVYITSTYQRTSTSKSTTIQKQWGLPLFLSLCLPRARWQNIIVLVIASHAIAVLGMMHILIVSISVDPAAAMSLLQIIPLVARTRMVLKKSYTIWVAERGEIASVCTGSSPYLDYLLN